MQKYENNSRANTQKRKKLYRRRSSRKSRVLNKKIYMTAS